MICQIPDCDEAAAVTTLSGLALCALHAHRPTPEALRPEKPAPAIDPESLPKALPQPVEDKAVKPRKNKAVTNEPIDGDSL